MKKSITILTTILLGLIFIYSAFSKIYPIELLENSLVDIGFTNWDYAPFFSRILIGFEFVLGIALLAQFQIKKITIPASIVSLFVFILYLFVLIIKYGDTGNCGCFGNQIHMTPLHAIYKNILLIIVLFFLYFFYNSHFKKNAIYKIIFAMLILSSVSLPFILNPVSLYEKGFNSLNEERVLSLDSFTKMDVKYNPKSTIALKENKQIIAYLNMECEHCMLTAHKLSIYKANNPRLPINFILNGNPKLYQKFIINNKIKNINCYLCRNYYFLKDTEGAFPKIYLVNNGKVEYACEKYYLMSIDDINIWYNN